MQPRLYNHDTNQKEDLMDELQVKAVKGEGELKKFITFPWEVYRDDPYWVPPLISDRLKFLNIEENPFFEHARVEYFMAWRGDQIVGTIAAFTNDAYNTFQEVNIGFFGFFEVLDDPEAASELLAKAEEWVREAGHESIMGPAQFSTNDEAFLLVDGFNDSPRALMTYNPPRYMSYLDAAGFEKAKDAWAYQNDLQEFIENVPPKLVRVTEKIMERRKLTVRAMNMKEYDAEVELFKQVYNSSWERNWGFVPFTDPELDKLAKDLKMFIDPDLALFVEYEGEVIGTSLSLPDLNQPLRLAYPRPGTPEVFTLLKLIWHWKVRKQVDWVRVIALGVLPEFRGVGVDALMYLETAKTAARKGYTKVESSWILEDNEMMNRAALMLGAEVYKTYRMYEKQV
jgi:GNAT superfamily N-acetyltransferase